MKAIVLTHYGSPDQLQLREVARPVIKDNQLLIRIRAATVTMGDCEMRALKFPVWMAILIRLWIGVFKPVRNILGQEFAGEVEAVGKAVTRFKVGDAVFGTSLGSYAEYIALSENDPLAIKPESIPCEEAAAIPLGGMESLHFLRQADIQPGEKVLINGAGGSIGTFGVQLARHYGAEVTAVDRAEKLDMLRSIGASHVIDYAQQDFTQNGQMYDVIFDVVGKSPYEASLQSLNSNGRYLLANPKFSQMIRGTRMLENGRKIITGPASPNPDDLRFLAGLVEAGTVRIVIDQRYPLEQAADAHRYVEAGHKKGNLILTL